MLDCLKIGGIVMKRTMLVCAFLFISIFFTNEIIGKSKGYIFSKDGYNGKIKVETKIEGETIKAIKVIKHKESGGVSDLALSLIPEKIIKNQSVNIDTVAGATFTSYGILDAVEAAIIASGLDIDNYQTEEKKDFIEYKDEKVDVVVVGAGGAGMAAALELKKDSDLSVILLEKLAITGGSTGVSGGTIWSIGSKYNKEHGIDMTEEELADFMSLRSGKEINRELVKKMGRVSSYLIEDYVAEGLPLNTESMRYTYSDSVNLGGMSPKNASSGSGGNQLMRWFEGKNIEAGVDLRFNSPVTELIIENDEVKGVRVKSDSGQEYEIRADRVILATGGFTRNKELIARLTPEHIGITPYTGAGSNGDGILMTESLNPEIVGEGHMGLRGMNERFGYYGSIGSLVNISQFIINKDGKRFANERKFYSEFYLDILAQEGKEVYAIVNGDHERKTDLEEGIKERVIKKYENLEELSKGLKVDISVLEKEINSYNKAYEEGKDGEFGIPNQNMTPIKEGPYYVVTIKPTLIGSIPGLKVNDRAQVLNTDGKIIKNLYGAGELIMGNVFSEFYVASGTGVATAIYTGYIAGNEVKKELR